MYLFHRIFVEKEVEQHPNTSFILNKLNNPPYEQIHSITSIFNQVKKNYLQKRDTRNLFIGKKYGELVKEAPNTYGSTCGKHYYFIHAYNCIYECEYCYLQGYFNSPDIVLFVNHDDIVKKIVTVSKKNIPETTWFHAGEFSDSLALNSLTNEYKIYWDTFKKLKHSFLELRTKSVNINHILSYKPLKNIVISFSMGTQRSVKEYEHNTASYKARLEAIKKLSTSGFRIGIHFDPIIYSDTFKKEYEVTIIDLLSVIKKASIAHISLGVIRFTPDVFREVKRNYPTSNFLKGEFIKSFDQKVRYPRPQRTWILETIKKMFLKHGVKANKIYFCME